MPAYESQSSLADLVESLTRLIGNHGRYSREEIISMSRIGSVEALDNGIFALSSKSQVSEAIDKAVEEHVLREYDTASGFPTRYGVSESIPLLDRLRVLDVGLQVGRCRKCGDVVLFSENREPIAHPFRAETKCTQLPSFIRIRELENRNRNQIVHYLIGNRCFLGVMVENNEGERYSVRFPGWSRITGRTRLPQLIRAWELLLDDSLTQRRIRSSYPGVVFNHTHILGIETHVRYKRRT